MLAVPRTADFIVCFTLHPLMLMIERACANYTKYIIHSFIHLLIRTRQQ